MKIMPIVAKTHFTGWTPTRNENKKQINKINEVLENSSIKRIAVSGHNFPDPDSIGACFAVAHILNIKTGQPIDIYIFGKIPKKFKYLEDRNIMNIYELDDNPQLLRNPPKKYDLAVSVDTSDTNLMDMDYYRNVFTKAEHTIKIDHHKIPEKMNPSLEKRINYAQINFTDSTSPSASQLIMQLTKPLGINPSKLPRDFNNAVYTGILGDTGCFNYATNRQPFYDTALLITNGLKPAFVMNKFNSKLSKEGYDIISLAKEKIKFSKNVSVAYLYIDDELKKILHSIEDEDMRIEINNRIKGLVNQLKDIDKVDISLVIKNKEDNNLYISARSKKTNVRKFAEKYNGGGHEKASGFCVPVAKKPEYTISNILKEMERFIEQDKRK